MNLKKFTQKNADGSSFTYEFDVPKMQGVPDHPGEPKGTDTVPAWLTPGEFVVNAEATRMFEPQIEAMNEAGRAVQRAQGGTIPEYHNDGGMAGNLAMVPRMGNMDMRMQSLIDAGYTPEEIEAAIGKLGNIGLLTDDLAVSLARTKNANQLSVQDEIPQMSLEDLAMSKLPQVQQEPMPESAVPQLNFRGQMPPVDDSTEIVKDALSNQRNFLKGRYSDDSRQQPAVPVSGIGTDLDIPDPNRPPMNVTSSFKDNLGFNPFDYIPDISLEGATEKLGSLFESMPDWMKTESSINQQQRARDLTPTGKANVIDTDFEYIGTDTPGKFALQPTKTTKTVKDIATGEVVQQLETVINDPAATEETKDTSEQDARKAAVKFINNISQDDEFGQTSIDGKEVVRKDGKTPDGGKDKDKGDGEGFLSKVTNFFQDNFSDLIDSDKLMNAALLYVGSRALGHSHAGSLNFVGRTYLGEIQKKLQVADKAALSNKYTKESVEKYRDTGKVEDLELKQNIQKLESFDMVDKKTGKTSVITKYEDKNTGKVTHLDSNGKPVKIENFRKLSDDVTISNAQMSKYSNNFEAEIKRQAKDDDELALFSRKLPNPQGFASQIAAKARELGLDENKINSIVPTITRQMIEDVKESDGELNINETLAIPYINAQLVSFSVKDNELKKNLEGASSKVLVTLSEKISNDPIELNAKLKDYSEQYSKLKPREKELFNKKAPDGFTGFTVYVSEQLLNK